jgi:hypothetical protein
MKKIALQNIIASLAIDAVEKDIMLPHATQ